MIESGECKTVPEAPNENELSDLEETLDQKLQHLQSIAYRIEDLLSLIKYGSKPECVTECKNMELSAGENRIERLRIKLHSDSEKSFNIINKTMNELERILK